MHPASAPERSWKPPVVAMVKDAAASAKSIACLLEPLHAGGGCRKPRPIPKTSMALFIVRHQHRAERCPAQDPDMGAVLLKHLSRPNVRQYGLTIQGEAVTLQRARALNPSRCPIRSWLLAR